MIIFLFWVLIRECFTYTHFPIRFNRKKKLVHVFHVGGKVKTYEWDKIYFTQVHYYQGFEGHKWYLSANILDEDGVTVRETFCASIYAREQEGLWRFWELICRYMEDKDGVRVAADRSWLFLPIADKRESWFYGFFIVMCRGGNPLMQLFMLLWVVPQSFARWFSMITSRIPRWPEEVEQLCEVDKNDRYSYDYRSPQLKKYTYYFFPWRLKELVSVTGRRWKL